MGKCVLCNKRKGKRFCKVVAQSICSECCGEKRFREVNCSKDCVYLKQATDYSSEKVIEIFPPWREKKLHLLLYSIRYSTHEFLKENQNFTDNEYKEVIELLKREYEIKLKNLVLPSLHPKSNRGTMLKNLLDDVLKDFLKKTDEFGFPIFSLEDIVKVLTWEREKIEEYQKNNKNIGSDFFLYNLKSYIEKIEPEKGKKSLIIYP
ncbi:MAG: hypothetical protein N2312_02630 [Dictyoglomaceae bacterium]|nr:hypothetical protein [Dictyoglomaceae bacterium]